MRHSQLRNVMERIFGVMKAGYKILTHRRPSRMESHVRVIITLCVLHNILNYYYEKNTKRRMRLRWLHMKALQLDSAERAYGATQKDTAATGLQRNAIRGTNVKWFRCEKTRDIRLRISS